MYSDVYKCNWIKKMGGVFSRMSKHYFSEHNPILLRRFSFSARKVSSEE